MPTRTQPIVLEHRVDLYVPSQCICGNSLPAGLRAEAIREVKDRFESWFGGHSEIPIKGGWRLPDGTLAAEDVSDIYAFCSLDALQKHQNDVDRLAVDIANHLTQDRVLRVFDNLNAALWPNTLTNLVRKKTCACHGGAAVSPTATAHPTEISKADRLSTMLIIQGILRSFRTLEHARRLFCDTLNYGYATGDLPWAKWPDAIRSLLAQAPALLADHNGFKIVHIRLSAEQLSRAAERQVIQRIIKDDPTFRGLLVASDDFGAAWELINAATRADQSRRLVFRRMRVGVESIRTATERVAMMEISEAEQDSITAEEIQRRHDQAFDVEEVTKRFFAEVANWYFWALKHARFPKDASKGKDGRDHVSLIRLITRLVFCWFVKEKDLIPSTVFDERELSRLLVGFAPDKPSNKDSVFYKAILQNLFFATLNTEMGQRAWRRNGQNLMAHSLYRYRQLFSRPEEALTLFKEIPFLNGGLFECLDKTLGDKTNPRYLRVDGFSDREDSQPTVPDFLFFGEEREIDLSGDYGDSGFKKTKVRGLIHTLKHYHFTVEESTPLEEEVALDPELAGKIFENLLAAYNPETGATARKQTGSFYTPRAIVDYMVDETLVAYLKDRIETSLPGAPDSDQRLRHLFSYEEEEQHRFKPDEVDVLISAIDRLKALDPAVGSGAFPMGILHKLVFILGRLDPRNERWKQRQIARLSDAISTAERIEDAATRETTQRELQRQIANVQDLFERNALDYGRKLFLIENCLFGVDIQPIAVQIAKMRFFISLVAEQRKDENAENVGVRPLPNLETKLVAANTLVGIDRPKQLMLRNPRIDALESDLRRVRERSFYARTPATKRTCQDQDKKLRAQIARLLETDGWGSKTATQLSSWDPYDQNSSCGFFDAEWMFGLRDGFDIIIGNPPYIKEYTHRSAFDGLRDSPYYQGKMDIWYLFACAGIDLLKQDTGILVFIATNNWVTNSGASKMRTKVVQGAQILQILDFGSYRIFESSDIQTMVMLFARNRKRSEYTFDYRRLDGAQATFNDVVDLLHRSQNERAHYLTPTFDRKNLADKPLTFSDPGREELLNKIQSKANLALDGRREIAQGIVAPQDSLNKTSQQVLGDGFAAGQGIFCLSEEEKEQLKFSKRELELIKPFYTTSELSRYYGNPKNRYWVIYTDSSFKHPKAIAPYPRIKRHLDRYRSIITSDNAPYGLHRARDERFFRGEKIMSLRKCGVPTFTHTNFDCYVSQTYFVVKTNRIDMKFLTALFNSRIVAFWLRHRGKMQGDQYQVDKEPLLRIPIAKPADAEPYAKLVDQILAAKRGNLGADTSALEAEIDRLIYRLYGLTKDEIRLIEKGR